MASSASTFLYKDISGTVLSEYKIIKPLGVGGEGNVFLIEDQKGNKFVLKTPVSTDELYAYSKLKQGSKNYLNNKLHPNLVDFHHVIAIPVEQMMGIFSYERFRQSGITISHSVYPGIVMEYCTMGDFNKFFKPNNSSQQRVILSPYEALCLLAQFMDGLQALQEQTLIHRDLKPANIFISKNNEGEHVLKIGDFGLATDETNPWQEGGANIYFTAPEIDNRTRYDKTVDIYSAGVIILELILLKTIDKYIDVTKSSEKYLNRDQRIKLANDLNEQINDLINKLLTQEGYVKYKSLLTILLEMVHKEPNERPSVQVVWEKVEKALDALNNDSLNKKPSQVDRLFMRPHYVNAEHKEDKEIKEHNEKCSKQHAMGYCLDKPIQGLKNDTQSWIASGRGNVMVRYYSVLDWGFYDSIAENEARIAKKRSAIPELESATRLQRFPHPGNLSFRQMSFTQNRDDYKEIDLFYDGMVEKNIGTHVAERLRTAEEKPLSLLQFSQFGYQLAGGLKVKHQQNISDNDISLHSIVIDRQQNDAKSFGFNSRCMSDQKEDQRHALKSNDVYSLGLTLLLLLVNNERQNPEPVLEEKSEIAIAANAQKISKEFAPMLNIILKMLASKPEARPTAERVEAEFKHLFKQSFFATVAQSVVEQNLMELKLA